MFNALWKLFFPKYTDSRLTPVKYAFPLVIMTALFASFASVISENSSYVTVRTSVNTVGQHDQFYIDISVKAHVPINAVDLVIAYPDKQIAVESIDIGTSVITLWTETPYAKNGNIYLRGGTFRKGFVGEHTIARVRAKALTAGDARILVTDTQLVAGDGLGTEVVTGSDTKNTQAYIKVVADGEGKITGEVLISVVTDIDGDGDIDMSDISAFMSAWFSKKSIYDFNGDGKMTIKDFSILLAAFFFK